MPWWSTFTQPTPLANSMLYQLGHLVLAGSISIAEEVGFLCIGLCRGRKAASAAMSTSMALCLAVSVLMIAQPVALLATDMTLKSGLSRTSKVGSS